MRVASTTSVIAMVLVLSACAIDVAGDGFGSPGPGAEAGSEPPGDDPDDEGGSAGSSGDGAEGPAEAEGSTTTAADDGAEDDTADPGDDDAGDGPEPGSSEGGDEASADETGPGASYDYGRCSDGCPADQCITIDGFDGSFCTTACVDGSCPPPPDGDATGQCLLGPDLMMPPVNCVLTCSVAGQGCPGDMVCVDAMMGGDAGICLWQ